MKRLSLGLKLLGGYVKSNQKSFLVGFILSLTAIIYLPKILSYLNLRPIATVGVVGNFTLSTLPREIQDQLSFGLVKLNPDGTVAPAVASTWQATDSGKTYVFKLNQSYRWSDGVKLDSSQINYNLRGVDISKPDGSTVKFSLREPFAPLLPLLSQPLFKNGLVGLGENQVTDVKFAGRFVSQLRLQNIKTKELLIYKFYPSEAELMTALKLGSIKKASGLHDLSGFRFPKTFQVSNKIDGYSQAVVFFNTQKPFFDDKAFRQALVYSLPNDFAEGQAADSPIPQNSWVGSLMTKKYSQNIVLAKNTLEKVASGSALPRIILSTSRKLRHTADEVALAWQNLGLNVIVETTDTRPINFDAFLTLVQLPVDPDQYALWHSTQTGNIAGYKSFKVNKLLEEGRQEIDKEKRQAIYQNFQKAITEDVPAAFLFYPKVYTISR